MSKTQAELDAAVIEAAETWYEYATKHYETHFFNQFLTPLEGAVRARREAMRPHKAALVSWMMETSEVPYHGEVMERWCKTDETDRTEARNRLTMLLAAPDEPTEGR